MIDDDDELEREAEANIEARGEPDPDEQQEVKRLMANMELMRDEHEAWIHACRELRARGIDVNDPEQAPVAHAFALWGERLHALRATQEEHIIIAARAEAEAKVTVPPYES